MKTVRNRFEASFQKIHPNLEYETVKLTYTLECSYTPDFIDRANKTIFETKGLFDAADRRRMLAVKKQHPDWRFVMVFQNPQRRISKSSRTTYAKWCDKHKVEWQTVK